MALIPMNELPIFNNNMMNNYLSKFRRTKSHLETSLVQHSKIKINKFNIQRIVSFKDVYQKTGKTFKEKDTYFIPLSVPLFTLDEIRKIVKNEPRIRNSAMIPLNEFINLTLKHLSTRKVFDIYFDGVKMLSSEFRVIVYKNEITLVTKSEPPIQSINIIQRPLVQDFLGNKNLIVIPSQYKHQFNSFFKIVFKDGKKTSDYVINDREDGGIEIVIEGDCKTSELLLFDGVFKQIKIPANTDWYDLNPNSKMTIDLDCTLCFMNGMYRDAIYEQKGNSIIRINSFANYEKELIVFYKESPIEVQTTTDYIEWYKNNISPNVVKELNAGTAPSLIKDFTNCNVDTTPKPADISRKDGNVYNTEIINKLIKYDPEIFSAYIETYVKHRDNYTKTYFLDMNIYDYIGMTRDNSNDVPLDKYHENFAFPMVLFTINNPTNRPFKVYVDGVCLYRHIVVKRCFGIDYIYVRKNKITPMTCVEIEYLNCDKNQIMFDVLIEEDGQFTMPEKYDFERYRGVIDIFNIDTSKVVHTDIISYENGIVRINNNGKRGLYKVVLNNTIVLSDYVVNSRVMETIMFNLTNFKYINIDLDKIRVFKNGKYIPRKYYTIELPTDANGLIYPKINVQCKCFMSEHIAVEYSPFKTSDLYEEDIIDEYGKIFVEKDTIGYPLTDNIDSFFLNGRKLNASNFKLHSSNAMELLNVLSRKHLTVQFKEDFIANTNFPDFTDMYKTSVNRYDDFKKSLITGSRVNDMETDVLEKDYNIMRDLYWDLYNEYLKRSIVDFGGDIPDYIAIKYADLVDLNDMVLIDCSEQMNHWMPLDASLQAEEQMDLLLQLYDDMLNELMNMEKIEPYELSKEQIERYKALANKNVWVVDLSHTSTKVTQ